MKLVANPRLVEIDFRLFFAATIGVRGHFGTGIDDLLEGFEALNERCKREADRAAKRRIADLAEAIAERSEVQAYWTAIMRGQRVPVIDPDTGLPELDDKGAPIYGPEPSMRDRTNASKHLADSLGMQAGCTTVIHEGGERPIVVKTQDLAERIKLVSRVTTTEEWLQ